MMRESMRRAPLIADISSGMERHKVWRLTDPFLIKKLRAAVARRPLFIADGHHRYEVARSFRKKMKGRTGNYVMAYFSNLLDGDLTILPIHRIVKGLKSDFETVHERLISLFTLKPFSNLSALLKAMEKKSNAHLFGMYWKGKPFYLLTLKDRKALSQIDAAFPCSKAWRRLDVTILHILVLKKKLGLSERLLRHNVLYSRDPEQGIERVRKGEYQAAFFLRPPRIREIQRIALSREKVPQKSTYFYPKPLTGLVMYQSQSAKRKMKNAKHKR